MHTKVGPKSRVDAPAHPAESPGEIPDPRVVDPRSVRAMHEHNPRRPRFAS